MTPADCPAPPAGGVMACDDIVPGYGSCVPSDGCLAEEDCYEAVANGGAVTVNVCTAPGCVSVVDDCPPSPALATAEPACTGIGAGDTCYLDCSSGETCPPGMICADNLCCAFDSNDQWACAIADPSFEGGQPNADWASDHNILPGVLPICSEAPTTACTRFASPG